MLIGIIVSYQPNLSELVSNSKNILSQVDKLILIENGSDKNSRSNPNRNQRFKITIHLESKNLGLGAAQNIGIKKAWNWEDFFYF